MDNSLKSLPRLLSLLVLALAPCLATAASIATEAYDRIIVQWRAAPPDGPAEKREALQLGERTGNAVALSRRIGGRFSVLQLERARSGAELASTLAALRADPNVELAEPDRRVHAHAYVPSDPLFTNQWYLKSVEPAAIRADAAWDITRGGATPATSSVVVAVVDTGVRFDHTDLRTAASGGKLLPGYDFVSGEDSNSFATANDGNGWDPDASDPGDFLTSTDLASPAFRNKGCEVGNSSWHGTRVSGMIAADTDNALGIAGTGFNIRILPVRVLGKCGGFDSDVIAGMYWASGLSIPPTFLNNATVPANPNPAQVINMSLGGTGPCSNVYITAVRDITAHGVLVVVSSGNEGEAVDSPANCPGALGVAGIRHIGTKVGYSNLGSEIGIAAPAGNCVNITAGSPCLFSLDTTDNDGFTTPGNSSYTTQLNGNVGTSFASPLVAGAAGLMKAVNPSLTPALLIARMKQTARTFPTTSDNAGVPNCVSPSLAPLQATECICNTSVCGAGMLDAGAAVAAALRPIALASFTGTVAIGSTLSLVGSTSGAAAGRTVVSYGWTVQSLAGGATTPMIVSANQPVATVQLPASGTYTFRLTVADNIGATDFADVAVTVAASGGGSNPPPPSSGGGGGGTAPGLLWLVGLMYLAREGKKWT